VADYTVLCNRTIGPFARSYIYALPTLLPIWIGGDDGNVYDAIPKGWSKYKSDNTFAISAWWRSKRLDFGDQYPELADRYKTLDTVILEYVDEDANTPVTIHISNDGGVTWASNTRLLGTGNGKQKSAIFYFSDSGKITGKYFTVKVESVSASTTFTWTGLFLKVEDRGPYFEIS